MRTAILPAALLFVLPLPALANAPAAPAAPAAPTAPAKEPAKVVVTAKDAVILSGASKAYYPVGHMGAGAILDVVDAGHPGYLEILPPGCCAAFVAKNKVKANEQDTQCTVTEDGVDCFSAGLEMTPAKSFRIMRKLAKGETLDILGSVGDHYRVDAPSKTTVFVPADQVRAATAADLKDGPPEAKADYKPAEAAAKPGEPKAHKKAEAKVEKTAEQKTEKKAEKQDEAKKADLAKPEPKQPEKTNDGIDSLAADPALRAAEGRRNEAYAAAKEAAVPAAKLKALLAEYTELAKRKDFNTIDGQLAAGRVAQLTRDLGISENLEKATAAEKAGIEAGKPPVTAPQIGYDAVGQLKASTLYDGTSLPKLYRLSDPASDALIAYVKPEAVDGALLNKLVGLQGEIEVDPNLKVRVIRVTKAEELKADGKK